MAGLWEEAVLDTIRIGMKDKAIDIPAGNLELSGSEHRNYYLVFCRKNGDCPKCLKTNCCENNCCDCCGHETAGDNFEARVQSVGVTADGDMRFVLPDALFERGKGRYMGKFVMPEKKDCKTVDKVICKFSLVLDEFLCLDFKRAKTVQMNDELLGGCHVEG